MTETILIVDDDANLLAAMKRQMRLRFTVATACGGEEALALLDGGQAPAVILCDMRMAGINGVQTLSQFKKRAPDTVRLMLTGNADLQTAIDAINDGHIFRFLTKPCQPETLEAGLQAALRQHRLITAEHELLEKTLAGSVKVLTDMLSLASPEGHARANRTRRWIRRLVNDLDPPDRWQLELAGLLSPLGMLSIPYEVIRKLQARLPLNAVERSLIERAPEAAANIIRNIPRLGPVADIVHLQSRGFDGSGFPADGPKGTEIPIGARILRVLNDLSVLGDEELPGPAAFLELAKRSAVYDPELFQRIQRSLEISGEPSPPPVLCAVSTGLLRPGMVLGADIVTKAGKLVLAAQETISEVHVERLRNLAKLQHIDDAVSVRVE